LIIFAGCEASVRVKQPDRRLSSKRRLDVKSRRDRYRRYDVVRMDAALNRQSDARSAYLDDVPFLLHGFGRRAMRPLSRISAREDVVRHLSSHGRTFFLGQVHGDRIVSAPFTGTPEADGALTASAGCIVAVETADCLPVILVEPRRRIAAIVHAGWRGTALDIMSRAVEEITARGGSVARLIAALGPCIGACCYEIGAELCAPNGPFDAAHIRRSAAGRAFLDLRAVNREQLERSGLNRDNIHSIDECTACRVDSYHSYRRDGHGTGRMISYAGWDNSLGE
jgi:YfiH family protein